MSNDAFEYYNSQDGLKLIYLLLSKFGHILPIKYVCKFSLLFITTIFHNNTHLWLPNSLLWD